ncbi:nuclear transport factor 2 family protein [Streptomyces sp. NBC_01142]|nr:nuclear transport factor 2 family protein [Streptomyces sp. NBC_01142]
MDGEEEQSVQAAVEGELRLLDPEVRASPGLVSALLDPEFFEFGVSGRRWDRTTILEATTPAAGEETAAVITGELSGTLLAPGLVQVTYVSDRSGIRAHRSSLWRRTAEGWRLYFHQGTPIPPDHAGRVPG